MKVRLGYACITNALDESSSSLLTYTHFKKLGSSGYNKLNEVIISNFNSLENILKYNISNDIKFYRLSSNIIPLISHPNVDIDLTNYKDYFKKVGDIINKNKLRVDMHIDPYYVLNSVNEDVVKSTINICKIYHNMFKLMNIKSNLIFHIGGKTISKEEGIKRFISNFKMLDKEIKDMILIENDDKIYDIIDCINISKSINCKIVLDYHHYMCNKGGVDIKDYLEYIFNTFEGIPKVHFSSPKSKKEYRAHHDYINIKEFVNFLDMIKVYNRDIDIMIEAKMKDDAVFRLIRQLKYLGYKVEGTTIIM